MHHLAMALDASTAGMPVFKYAIVAERLADADEERITERKAAEVRRAKSNKRRPRTGLGIRRRAKPTGAA
jgi:hypothetical protein